MSMATAPSNEKRARPGRCRVLSDGGSAPVVSRAGVAVVGLRTTTRVEPWKGFLPVIVMHLTGENSKEILYCVLQSKVAKMVELGVGSKIFSPKGGCITIKIPFCD